MPGQLPAILAAIEAAGDMAMALLPVRKLAKLEVRTVLCYHDGPFSPGAGERLRDIVRA